MMPDDREGLIIFPCKWKQSSVYMNTYVRYIHRVWKNNFIASEASSFFKLAN